MKTTLLALFGALIFFAAQAGTIAVDPTKGINGLVSGYGGLTLGWEFEVTDTNGITVDGLGFWDYQSDGFLFGQTFPVGLWDALTGALLVETVVTSASPLFRSLDPDGAWRVSSILPLILPPGLYRIGALIPEAGANQFIGSGATFQSAAGITLVRFLRQIGSPTLAMPDIGVPTSDSTFFGPTFTSSAQPVTPPLSGLVVAPGNFAATAGNGGANTLLRNNGFPRTYQMQFTRAALGGLPVGARITELRFRLNTNAVPLTSFPTATTTWAIYQVTLAQAAHSISGMSTNFAANMLSPILVKDGALSLGANSFTTGPLPNPFCSLIVFDTPYVYQGGDLVMLFAHAGSDSTSTAYLDAASSSSAGYGTNFRAISATAFNAVTGIPASVTIAQIVFTAPPDAAIFRDGTNVVIVGKGGAPGAACRILSSMGMVLPISQWTPIATNIFDATGMFRYTNAINSAPLRFFCLALP